MYKLTITIRPFLSDIKSELGFKPMETLDECMEFIKTFKKYYMPGQLESCKYQIEVC